MASDADVVVVMDADGEDKPSDLLALIQAHYAQPKSIIVAQRKSRSENHTFRLSYFFYKQIFWLLVGERIDFGNFCLIPSRYLRRLSYDPNLWNNLAGAVLRSRIQVLRLPTHRGTRYAGHSSMNFVRLVTHGLSIIAVYTDRVVVRLIVLCVSVFMLTLVMIMGVVAIRLFTDLAIPGWATNTIGVLVVIALQTILFSVTLALMHLSMQSRKSTIPAEDAPKFIEKSVIYYDKP